MFTTPLTSELLQANYKQDTFIGSRVAEYRDFDYLKGGNTVAVTLVKSGVKKVTLGYIKASKSSIDDSINDFEIFRNLKKSWEQETNCSSSAEEVYFNDNYFKIIGMGMKAVPFILNELKKDKFIWFHALGVITREDSIVNDSSATVEDAKKAWLSWGEKKKLITAG